MTSRLLFSVVFLVAFLPPSSTFEDRESTDKPSYQSSSEKSPVLQSPLGLQDLAQTYYAWRDSCYPVLTSDAGKHRWDHKITDYRMSSVLTRRKYVRELLAKVRSIETKSWSKDGRIDCVLFRAQLESEDFFARVMNFEESDPQRYVDESSTAIFSLLKKEYAGHRQRALAAIARLEQIPDMLAIARSNLKHPIRLYATLAIEAARGGDELYSKSLMTIADSLTAQEHTQLVSARDKAIGALHEFADWLEKKLPSMAAWKPMGEASYSYLLKHVLLLPLDAGEVATIGEGELARFRALEAMLKDPTLASPDPTRATRIPKDQEDFLTVYESRLKEISDFLRNTRLVTIPNYIGSFQIRQLPEAFKPTYPGGFMNPPGVYDSDPSGFYFIPTYNPNSRNFYIRAAIEDPRPILGHEGIPGHFLQISIANRLPNEIRRQHFDNTFIEGWALYGEEMLMRQGLYPDQSSSQGQVLRLSRYRAARIGVDANLHTGRWTFDEAVKYFEIEGGLDHEAAFGEAAGAASRPSQKIGYMIGKWQIMRLLGRYRDQQGVNFRLGAFHDELISFGSLPLSVIEWLMLDDQNLLVKVLK